MKHVLYKAETIYPTGSGAWHNDCEYKLDVQVVDGSTAQDLVEKEYKFATTKSIEKLVCEAYLTGNLPNRETTQALEGNHERALEFLLNEKMSGE